MPPHALAVLLAAMAGEAQEEEEGERCNRAATELQQSCLARQDKDGDTVLHVCVRARHEGMLEALLACCRCSMLCC
jgi:hypothetical protein